MDLGLAGPRSWFPGADRPWGLALPWRLREGRGLSHGSHSEPGICAERIGARTGSIGKGRVGLRMGGLGRSRWQGTETSDLLGRGDRLSRPPALAEATAPLPHHSPGLSSPLSHSHQGAMSSSFSGCRDAGQSPHPQPGSQGLSGPQLCAQALPIHQPTAGRTSLKALCSRSPPSLCRRSLWSPSSFRTGCTVTAFSKPLGWSGGLGPTSLWAVLGLLLLGAPGVLCMAGEGFGLEKGGWG